MNKLTLTGAVFMAMAATSVFAHHPAALIVDETTYTMIEDNLEAADSPHLDMTFEDMGSVTATGSSDMVQAERAMSGWQYEQAQAGDVPPLDPVVPVETIDLLDTVEGAL